MNSKEKKIVFFDIDGTILDGPTQTIPESAVRAIRKMRENGYLAFINTGRPYVSIPPAVREIGFDGYVCGCGTHIVCDGDMIDSHAIPHEKCVEIVQMTRKLRVTAFFESNDTVYMDRKFVEENPIMAEVNQNFRKNGVNVQDFPEDLDTVDFTFHKFYCVRHEKADMEGMVKYAEADFSVTPQWAGDMEFVPKECSKAEGIYFLQRKFGIDLENCYAIGDSENDLPMLEAVPHSIAMGNSKEAILPYCTYQTAAILEDGIEKALAHFGLI